jgi:HK97 family phage prohead protease
VTDRLIGIEAWLKEYGKGDTSPDDVVVVTQGFLNSGRVDRQVEPGIDPDVVAQENPDTNRQLPFIISTESSDRYGDTIAVNGWQLDKYNQNPVVLWAHDSRKLPVGRAVRTWIDPVQGALRSIAEFMPVGVDSFADTVFQMLKLGFLNAVSVGFKPVKWAYKEGDGWDASVEFLEQELLEYSVVPIPANTDALVQARNFGIDMHPIRDWAEEVLTLTNGRGFWLNQEEVLKRAVQIGTNERRTFGVQAVASNTVGDYTKDGSDGPVTGELPTEAPVPEAPPTEAPVSETLASEPSNTESVPIKSLKDSVTIQVSMSDGEPVTKDIITKLINSAIVAALKSQ